MEFINNSTGAVTSIRLMVGGRDELPHIVGSHYDATISLMTLEDGTSAWRGDAESIQWWQDYADKAQEAEDALLAVTAEQRGTIVAAAGNYELGDQPGAILSAIAELNIRYAPEHLIGFCKGERPLEFERDT